MLKIENQVFILKKDVIEFLKDEIGEASFESVKKLIDNIEVVNNEYLNVDSVYSILDAFYDDDELFDEFIKFMIKFNALPKIRFVKDYIDILPRL